MKKLLLISSFLLALTTQAQDYWTEYATGQATASTGVRSISPIDANTTWLNFACGTSGCTAIRRWGLSTNGGTVWTTGVVNLGASSTSLEIANIDGVSATTAYAAAFPTATATGGVWKTANSGSTWTRQATALYNDTASFTDFVHFWDANNGLAFGDPDSAGYFEIYTTTNGGTTWTRVASTTPIVAIDPQEYGLTNQFIVSGNTVWAGTTFGRILKSSDKGYTWTAVQAPAELTDFGGGINGTTSGDMAFSDENNGLLLVTDSSSGTISLYNSIDGGTTWNSVSTTGQLYSFDVAAVPGAAGTYISIGNTDPSDNTSVRGSSFSTDSGVTWTDINDNPDANYVDGSVVRFYNSAVGFAGGFSTSASVGGVFKWNNNPLATKAFANENTVKITPNPTNGVVGISGKNIAQVTITDILGKVIATSNYSSLSAVSLDITSYNAGVYMVKVTNDLGNTSTVKVIKQ